ncbi:helix-turn-helix transcriptional regulator [Candidatus Chloroploca sp. Khr17]|uniref:helix-turn-helix domain-containing protein n=1 Tax=Candidatus Chloroploca sp. Khr17 TaxID=2496869 RepID=UPI00101D1CA2|nr:helix-turn-helix transcriptional regulator [Candidatus Chloroploca sp. Khr17]
MEEPIAVLLFHRAMSRGQSLSDFAEEVGIGTISLRQFMLGKTTRPRERTMEALSSVLDLPIEEIRQRMGRQPEAAPPFGAWLKAEMEGRFSRSRLNREAKISDGAMRNYLSNRTLPDADQAQRLAEVLGVVPLELARIIVANQFAEAGIVLMNGQMVAPINNEAVVSAEGAVVAWAELNGSGAKPSGQELSSDEVQLLGLWRQLHPQAKRATLGYLAILASE